MNVRRIDWGYDICDYASRVFTHVYHRVEFSGMEHVPEQGPVLLVAKHVSLKDIMLEAEFSRKHCGRYCNWIMKSSLPGLYNHTGGIKVSRVRDVKHIKDRTKRRKALLNAKATNEAAMEYVRFLFNAGEMLFVHPEGTRIPGKVGALRKEFFDVTRNVQEKDNITVPVIPVGFEYESLWTLRSRIHVRTGPPIDITHPDLLKIVATELARLSNLPAPPTPQSE